MIVTPAEAGVSGGRDGVGVMKLSRDPGLRRDDDYLPRTIFTSACVKFVSAPSGASSAMAVVK